MHKYILVSTYKAANPASVMGATKKLAEKVVIELNKKNHTS
ncbi:MAG: polysaccharide biosynthesis protein [Candidatus Methanoperedens sp.]|nr:polysaccharide biosynthesis protein [Candidatus Methanoperedens sp.]MCE8428666.1 polysaccharide biosynthesis protein [Candidatus Methanoperedens sp.]